MNGTHPFSIRYKLLQSPPNAAATRHVNDIVHIIPIDPGCYIPDGLPAFPNAIAVLKYGPIQIREKTSHDIHAYQWPVYFPEIEAGTLDPGLFAVVRHSGRELSKPGPVFCKRNIG